MTTTQNGTYYQKNKVKLLQKAKDYYEKQKEQRKEYRRNKCNNMRNEGRLKVLEYWKNWDHKLDLERKRKIREYSKTISHPIEVN